MIRHIHHKAMAEAVQKAVTPDPSAPAAVTAPAPTSRARRVARAAAATLPAARAISGADTWFPVPLPGPKPSRPRPAICLGAMRFPVQ
jgi:hypothetical protein